MHAQTYKTKAELSIEMLNELKGKITYDWVGGDSIYGNSHSLRNYLISQKQDFVLDVGQELKVYLAHPQPSIPQATSNIGRKPSKEQSSLQSISLRQIAEQINENQWQIIRYRKGTKAHQTKGKLTRKATLIDVWLWSEGESAQQFKLLISKELDDSEIKFSLCYCANNEHTIDVLLYRQMQRYWIERAFQDVKEQLGIHQYQVRLFKAWYHHIALTMMALLFMLEQRIQNKEEIPLLSCADIKLMLANTMANKLKNENELWKAIELRHQNRINSSFRNIYRI